MTPIIKRSIAIIMLLSFLLTSAIAFVSCTGEEEKEEGSDTEPKESISDTDGEGEDSKKEDNEDDDRDMNDYLALTQNGEPLYVIAYQSLNIIEGFEGTAIAGDYAKAANQLAAKLEGMLADLDVKVISDRKLSENNKKVIGIGNIVGISDSSYSDLRYSDYKITENDGNIGVAAYTSGILSVVLGELTKNIEVIDGDVYVKRSALSLTHSYRYRISEINIGGTPIEEYVISCDADTLQAADDIKDKIVSVNGVFMTVVQDGDAEKAIVIKKDSDISGYKVTKSGNKLNITYASDMDWSMLFQNIVKLIDGVEVGGVWDLSCIVSESDSSSQRVIMSFNVLNVWNKNGTPGNRDDIAAAMVLGYLPDFIGLQEFDIGYRNAENGFISKISDMYAEVEIAGVEKDYIWNPIFYLKNKYTVVESGFVYLPNETESHESANYYGGTPDNKARFRSVVWAVLRDTDGREFVVGNLHFSPGVGDIDISKLHPGEAEVAVRTIKQIAERYEGCVTLVTGDYNSTRNNSTGGVAKMVASGFADTYDMAETRTDIKSNHDLGAAPSSGYKSGAIDHILTLNQLNVSAYMILTDSELLSISDHCPTLVRFTVTEQ